MYIYGSYHKIKTGVPLFGPLCRTKHEVDRMIRCQYMAVRNFPRYEVDQTVVNIYIDLMYSSTVRNVAREE